MSLIQNSDIPGMFETKTMLMGPGKSGKSMFLQKLVNNSTEVPQTNTSKSRKTPKLTQKFRECSAKKSKSTASTKSNSKFGTAAGRPKWTIFGALTSRVASPVRNNKRLHRKYSFLRLDEHQKFRKPERMGRTGPGEFE